MKITYLIVGLLVGGIVSFFLTKSFYQISSAQPGNPTQASSDTPLTASTWSWSDSLDAVKAAPKSHKIVYEDSTVRILQVTLEANKTEPIHTHKWKSIMWFTRATPMTYYKQGLTNNTYIIEDSIPIPQMPPEVLNHGDVVEAEGPHAIKNTSNEDGVAYRVEFKKEFKP
jgi:quercetin dioxygenase-like cupin family protein